MSAKYRILNSGEHISSRRVEYVKKSVALLLIRRSAVESIAYRVIRRVTPGKPTNAPRKRPHFAGYEHHIEPKIQQFNYGNNDWIAYLEGYGYRAAL